MKMCFEISDLKQVPKDKFVYFWSKEYFYDLEDLYVDNIKKKLTKKSVRALFRWKSGKKKKIPREGRLEIYFSELQKLPKLKNHNEGKKYIEKLRGGGPIWNIFWLHCLRPNLFPIFDQHTYRAMTQILHGKHSEIPSSKKEKIRIYFEEYRPFILRLFEQKPRVKELRQMDKALFEYGKFLKKFPRKSTI